MIFYRTAETDDPLYRVYSSREWLHDYDDPILPFPLIVDLELTNHCNLDCIFCQRRISEAPRGRMSAAHFRQIVDECAHHNAPIRISGWGEPLIHKQVADFIAYANSQGVTTKIYTNGLLLTESRMRALIEAGLDELQFSMQGLDEAQYARNRRKGDYGKLAANIRMAARERTRAGGTTPFLGISTSVLGDELAAGDVDQFRDDWLQHVDKVSVDMTNLNFVGGEGDVQPLLDQHLLEPVHSPCVDIFLKIHIAWNGHLDICAQDAHHYPEYVLGHLDSMSIEQAWTSDQFEAHRDQVGRALNHERFRLCRNCYITTHKYDHLKAD